MSSEVALQLQALLQKFIDHVDNMQIEEDEAGNGLEKQFRELRDLTMKQRDENILPATEGRKPYNMKKNRYKDILPFDSTRVPLKEIPDEPGSDYINANFIQGVDFASQYYIASQGPLPNTVDDFWRMLWENNVIVVFMACKLVELGKKKCEQYWPDEVGSKKQFGEIEVTLTKEENRSEHYIMRNFEAKYNGETHTLIQLHYNGWPDHDIPEDIETILEMIAEMRRMRKDHESVATKRPPAVIHCSAGCGRTGTICAIDYVWDILQTGKLTPDFDLYKIIKHMREQRQSMIQTPDQYEMVYKATQQLFKEHLDMMQDHDYGNLKFGQDPGEEEGDDESEPQITGGEKHRKHSIVPEIQEALHKYGIETEVSVPAEEKSPSSLKATRALFEQIQSPVLISKESFEPRKMNENLQGNAHMNSTVEMFEKMQTKISPSTPLTPLKAKPQQPLQAATGNIELGKDPLVQTQGFINADPWKPEILQPKPVPQEQTASNSYMKKNLFLNSDEDKNGKHVTRITVGAKPALTSEIKRIPSDPADKSHGRLNSQGSSSKAYASADPNTLDTEDSGALNSQGPYSYAYASADPSKLDTKDSGTYAYASVDVAGRQEAEKSIGSVGNNIYSSVKKTQNGAPSSSAADFYTPVQKTSQNKKPAWTRFNEDDPYETVQIWSEGIKDDEPPSLPDRGYIDEPPKLISSNSITDNKEKSKGMFKTASSSSEFGKRIEKKFKGPRPPPAEWTKGKH
ncbi:hypothetical protein CHS0354_002431 [Potamilus streckersoni]|uniref:protein-tyrosine-phosphatase n=1 Tax=Potamilus streckersoni TaxID=2493646 RepID=A0AAE0T8N2_9BIVA|nr:hypothetical protein CHS0354_002431 [Potamilus streckersoni]